MYKLKQTHTDKLNKSSISNKELKKLNLTLKYKNYIIICIYILIYIYIHEYSLLITLLYINH